MDAHYPTVEKPASPEYVLAVIRDNHRQQSEFDPEADGEAKLTFEDHRRRVAGGVRPPRLAAIEPGAQRVLAHRRFHDRVEERAQTRARKAARGRMRS